MGFNILENFLSPLIRIWRIRGRIQKAPESVSGSETLFFRHSSGRVACQTYSIWGENQILRMRINHQVLNDVD